ncbi:hypothetical protein PIROE2DRAFT_13520 [Piromyces sp. E2]|nr:hypothetical protein PIROE2DRAFT_13520 [Piromyces sp. E2]|eukprot:OUM60660.1 hypothetical protein PIROE2DRAFT_13520 [Piromyces sp. E2]
MIIFDILIGHCIHKEHKLTIDPEDDCLYRKTFEGKMENVAEPYAQNTHLIMDLLRSNKAENYGKYVWECHRGGKISSYN